MINYNLCKKILFKFEPETAHNIAECGLKLISSVPILNTYIKKSLNFEDKALNIELFGTTFKNPLVLAAGFDKNASMINGIELLGFSCDEIGTVTPRPQSGNSKPRLFRYPKHNSIQNAMGFNNIGSFSILKNLKKYRNKDYPIGINIGKNKTTPLEYSLEDYRVLFKRFDKYATYFVVNISSPNTPNLRDLQNEVFIKSVFELAKETSSKPVLLKIAPDMSIEDAINISKIAVEAGANGIIATNTTTDYSLLENSKKFGGLSGEVLKDKSFEIFSAIAKELYGKTVLISVGGISDAQEAYRRIKAGASLVQIYSGFIFQGPLMNRKINQKLLELLKKDGFDNISQAIGCDIKNDK